MELRVVSPSLLKLTVIIKEELDCFSTLAFISGWKIVLLCILFNLQHVLGLDAMPMRPIV